MTSLFENSSLTELLRGLKVLLLSADPAAVARLSTALQDADIALASPGWEQEMGVLDADLILIDRCSRAELRASLSRLREHPRGQWGAFVPMDFGLVAPVDGPVELSQLAVLLGHSLADDQALQERSRDELRFETDLVPLGPARMLRALIRSGRWLRMQLTRGDLRIWVDLAEGMVVSAHGQFGEEEWEGEQALAMLFEQPEGTVTVEQRDHASRVNLMAPVGEAMSGALVQHLSNASEALPEVTTAVTHVDAIGGAPTPVAASAELHSEEIDDLARTLTREPDDLPAATDTADSEAAATSRVLSLEPGALGRARGGRPFLDTSAPPEPRSRPALLALGAALLVMGAVLLQPRLLGREDLSFLQGEKLPEATTVTASEQSTEQVSPAAVLVPTPVVAGESTEHVAAVAAVMAPLPAPATPEHSPAPSTPVTASPVASDEVRAGDANTADTSEVVPAGSAEAIEDEDRKQRRKARRRAYSRKLSKRARVFRRRGKDAHAQRLYLRALELDVHNARANAAMARYRRIEGRLDDALDHISDAVRHRRKRIGYRLLYADLLRRASRSGEAANQYQKVLALDPFNDAASDALDGMNRSREVRDLRAGRRARQRRAALP